MAKSKPSSPDQFDDAPAPDTSATPLRGDPQADFADAPPAPARPAARPDPEREALLRELERARRERDEARAALAAAPPSGKPTFGPLPEPGSGKFWEVRLEGGKTHVVEAPDPANAWAVYCHEMGVLHSEQLPEVNPASRESWEEAQARRYQSHEAVKAVRQG